MDEVKRVYRRVNGKMVLVELKPKRKKVERTFVAAVEPEKPEPEPEPIEKPKTKTTKKRRSKK
jgi:hypothetical protein